MLVTWLGARRQRLARCSAPCTPFESLETKKRATTSRKQSTALGRMLALAWASLHGSAHMSHQGNRSQAERLRTDTGFAWKPYDCAPSGGAFSAAASCTPDDKYITPCARVSGAHTLSQHEEAHKRSRNL